MDAAFCRSTLIALSLAATTVGCTAEKTPTQTGDDAEPPSADRCFGKCDSFDDENTSDWEADLQALGEAFPDPSGNAPIESVDDLYSVVMQLGGQTLTAPTHLFGRQTRVVPYGDIEPVETAGGTTIERRDRAVAKLYRPGEVGIAVKHHRPEHRFFKMSDSTGKLKEQFKLQDTHGMFPIGVERDGAPGAVTMNNPQTYQDGLFGSPDYQMMFFKPVYPGYLEPQQRAMVVDNVRNWLMVMASVTEFPGDYNGNDPLAAASPERVRTYARQGIRAIAGDEEAIEWFSKDENLLYCSELGYMSFTLGARIPMTESYLSDLVDTTTWEAFQAEVKKHNEAIAALQAGEADAFAEPPSQFEKLNRNDKIRYVELAESIPEQLQPIYEYAPTAEMREQEAKKMAFAPMTAADLVDQFLRIYIPRRKIGEQIAPLQGGLLEQMKPGLFELMGIGRLPEDDPRRQKMDQLYAQLVEIVKTEHEDYEAFRRALKPLLEKARQVTSSRPGAEVSLYAPPSIYHSIAKGTHDGGLIDVRYAGHGIHWNHVRARDGVEETVDTADTGVSDDADPTRDAGTADANQSDSGD